MAWTLLRAYWFLFRTEVNGVKCVLTDSGRVLLVRHTYGKRTWDLPGGSLKRGEPPSVAARREIHEELGIEVSDWASLGAVADRLNHRRDNMHCFQAEVSGARLEINRCQLAAVDWFSRQELPPDLAPYVQRILARVAG